MARKVWIIMGDQLSYRYLAYRGINPWMITPNIDALARKSIDFRRAYCASPLCVPSRQTLYTGVGTRKHRCLCDYRVLRHPTMFHQLAKDGIRSIGVGKLDFRHDSDQFHGLERPGGDIGAQDLAQGVNNYSSFIGHPVRTTRRMEDAQCDAITETSLDALKNPGPLLVLTSYLKPHESWDNGLWYDAPQRFFDKYDPKRFQEGREWGYAANVSLLDSHLGRCMKTAAERGLLNDTLVIFTSDHGEMAGVEGKWGKLCLHEAAIRVPLMMWHRGITPQIEYRPVGLIDLSATVADWLGVAPIGDGTSLLSSQQPEGYHLFTEYLDGQFYNQCYRDWDRQPITYNSGINRIHRALISDQWKITHENDQWRLWRHTDDDALIDCTQSHPKLLKFLKNRMESLYPREEAVSRHDFVPDKLI